MYEPRDEQNYSTFSPPDRVENDCTSPFRQGERQKPANVRLTSRESPVQQGVLRGRPSGATRPRQGTVATRQNRHPGLARTSQPPTAQPRSGGEGQRAIKSRGLSRLRFPYSPRQLQLSLSRSLLRQQDEQLWYELPPLATPFSSSRAAAS